MKLSLYHSPWCPYCIKVVLALKSMPVNVELRSTEQQKNFSALQKGGGKTQVPCLLIEENSQQQWMYESADIIKFLKTL